MKRSEINNILNNSSIKNLVYSQKGGSWKLHDLLVLELGEDKCPSETAIITYIRKQLNFIWDKEKHLWVASKEDTNPTKKGRKKRRNNSPETFTKTYEVEIDDDDNSIPKDEDLSISENSTNSNPSEKNDENFTTNTNLSGTKNEEKSVPSSTNANQCTQSKKISNSEKDISEMDDSSSTSKSKLKYKNIDPSRYAEYIEYSGSQKYSLSLSPFVIGLVEEIIFEKYNKKQTSKSKVVQLALIEYIRIKTTDTSKDTP